MFIEIGGLAIFSRFAFVIAKPLPGKESKVGRFIYCKSHHWQHRSIHCYQFLLYAGLGFFILPTFWPAWPDGAS